MAPPDLTSPGGSSNSGGSPAGYGRSCTNCSRAKCKCILRAPGTSCERCHRLGKECNPIQATRKRVEKKHTSSRTAQLEEKLDDLVSILRSSQGGSIPHPRAAVPHPPSTSSCEVSNLNPQISRLDSLATAATASGPHASYCSPSTGLHHNVNDAHSEPTPAEAEVYLQKFKAWLKNFPFMYISPDVTAHDLRRERPFLWLAIMTITTMSVPQMAVLKHRIRQEIAEIVVVRHEPSMDILQGVIAFVGWATMNPGPGWKPFLILFSQLAKSVAYELGLTRSPAEEQYFATCFKPWGGRHPQPKPRTPEERRALLGLWHLTSMTASFIGKMDPLRWTLHMEESLEILEREREHSQDEILATLVRMQLVADEAHKLLIQDMMRGEESGQPPSWVHRRSLLDRLQAVRDGMAPSANASYVVQAQGYAAEVLVHSMGLFGPNMPEGQRIDALYSSLRAVRSWYDIWFSIPLSEIPSLPFNMYIQLSQTQVALYRVTTIDDPAWDKEVIRNTADLLVILDRTIARFEQMGSVYPMKTTEEDGTLFTKAAKIMRNVRASWEPKLTQNLHGLPTPNSQQAAVGNSGGGPLGMAAEPAPATMPPGGPGMAAGGPAFVDPVSLDFSDLGWMTDVFGPWEF